VSLFKWTESEIALFYNPSDANIPPTMRVVDISKGLTESNEEVVIDDGKKKTHYIDLNKDYLFEDVWDCNGIKNYILIKEPGDDDDFLSLIDPNYGNPKDKRPIPL